MMWLGSDPALGGTRVLSLQSFLSGSGPNRGHYITIVKSHGFWLLFDDDIVEVGVLRGASEHEGCIGSSWGVLPAWSG